MSDKMPKHIVTLLLMLGVFLLLAYGAKIYLTDPSFYRYGQYRADAVPELAAGTPLFKGSAYCQACHSEGYSYGSAGAHGSVQCEVCHGVDPGHPDNPRTLVPADTVELCALCHAAMPARPAGHPQVVVAEHPFPDEEPQQCIDCHDPHSPGDGEPGAQAPGAETPGTATAAAGNGDVPETVSKCVKCHGQYGEGRKKNPAIAGLESGAFIDLMNAYVSGEREHKAMARIVEALSNEELLELSRYYERLPAEATE